MKPDLFKWYVLSMCLVVILLPADKGYGQDGIDKYCIEYNGKTLFVADPVLAKKYLDSILGTWEDGKGTIVKLYIKDNPDYSPNPTNLFERGELIMAADIEMYPEVYWPYDLDGKKEELSYTHYNLNEDSGKFQVIRQVASKNGWVIDKIKAFNADWCVFYPGKEEQKDFVDECTASTGQHYFDRYRKHETVKFWRTGTGPLYAKLVISSRSGSRSFQFDFINGCITGNCFLEYPAPLQRTAKGIDENKKPEYVFKAAVLPKEVKPDGESTVAITAALHEYIPGDNQSVKPVSGQTVRFKVDMQQDITPGTLSAASAVTDINGQVSVVYTAPTADILKQAGLLVNTAAVTLQCAELNIEEMVYISFTPDRGKVFVEPAIGGIVSSYGIVPPDRRFPALIRAYVEDENLNPLINTEVTFAITGSNLLGIVRDSSGKEGRQVAVKTDKDGFAEVQYCFAAGDPPAKPVTETVAITSPDMAIPLKAEIAIGLNIIFDLVESGYEGKGLVNAGEEIPLRIRIRDAWNPDLDLDGILTYWGLGGQSGDTALAVRLDVQNLSCVPACLLDQLKLEHYPEAAFVENMNVRSFKDKGVLNMLWMPEHTLKSYKGYPRIRPMTTGNHYYEARVTLTDGQGGEVFPSRHPARKAYFNLQTGLPADAMQIYFISNPFNTETREAKLLATVLDLMGFGALLSIPDALYKINQGDTEGLLSLLFSEIKGVILEKAKSRSAYSELAVDLYSGLALAEKVDFEIMKEKTGPLAAMEGALFQNLVNAFKWNPGQLVILRGDGGQRLFEDIEGAAPEANEIRAEEGAFIRDEARSVTSLKNGGVTVYSIPASMKVRQEHASEMKRY